MFSRRTGWDRAPNALALQLEARRRRGLPILDLTRSNPTDCGLAYPVEQIQAALDFRRARTYAPSPLGLETAREAVARTYARKGVAVEPAQIVLTASTSEAYGFLFKLLADPGDAVLLPRPGYPLFDFLAGLESLQVRSYPLLYDGTWSIDLDALDALAPGARALVWVSPHNPTGQRVTRPELERMSALAAAHDLALVADEVFADYPRGPSSPAHLVSLAGQGEVLGFTLGGLSKIAGLPQLKLGWIVVSGPAAARREALERLELIADTALSVGAPVQHALGELLALGEGIQAQVRARIAANDATLRASRPEGAPWTVLGCEGGWSAMLHVSRARSEEAWCEALLDAGVWLHPGYFFDLPRPGYLVLSLLTAPEILEAALPRLAEVLGRA